MRHSKQILIFISVLMGVSIVTGFIYGINNYYDLTDYITNLSTHNNMFIYHIIVLLLFLFSTISLLGIVFESIYIGFEGVSIGYIISLFYANFKIKGLLYSFIVVLVNKLVFIIVITYLFLISVNYIRKNFHNLIGINKDYLINLVKPLLQKYAIVFVVLLIYDVIIYFFGNTCLNYLTFML